MWKYYVYIWYDTRTNKPFYVGKGTGKRMHMLHDRSTKFLRKYSSLKGYVDVTEIAYFKESKDALNFECELISELGLETLTNITPGGEGVDSSTARRNALKRAAKGTMGTQQEYARQLSVQRAKHRASKGELELQKPGRASELSKIQVAKGTHPLLSGEVQRKTNLKLLAKGTHLFQRPGFHKESQRKALENGTHSSIKNSKPFSVQNIETKEVIKYISISDCARKLNISTETAHKIYHYKTGKRTRHPYRRVTFND